MVETKQKKERVLGIFYRLIQGEHVTLKNLSQEYEVSVKSISRDMNEIKNFLADHRDVTKNMELKYSHEWKAYQMEGNNCLLSGELLFVMKILSGVRAIDKIALLDLFDKLERFTVKEDREMLEQLSAKEIYHYQGVSHFCDDLINLIWKITNCIYKQKEITISYHKMDGSRIERRVQPLSIIFSEFYFYLIAGSSGENEDTPHYYRIDRITQLTEHRDTFHIEYADRFDEGELRKKIQYMFPGKSRKIIFEFTGPSVQAILDRLQTAKIIGKKDDKYLIEAETYGTGIKMFLLSQGQWVKVLKPESFAEEITREIETMYKNYIGD